MTATRGVRKAARSIPEVVAAALSELRAPGARRLQLPSTCPECGSTLVREEGGRHPLR